MRQFIENSIKPKTFGISYMGKMRWCGMDKYIEDLNKAVENNEGAIQWKEWTLGENGYPVFTNIHDCDVTADVIIDFAATAAVEDLLTYAVERQIPVVLCTTGLSKEQIALVDEASQKVAILRSANMSLGINTLLKMIKEATNVFAPAGFDIEIVEKHHNKKVDAPSGTALALADSINEELDNEYAYCYDRSDRREKREKKEIGILVNMKQRIQFIFQFHLL